MYGLGELKAKTIRSWARAFGEELESGAGYVEQPPTIAITFADGRVESIEDIKMSPRQVAATTDKIHKLCMIMDCEDFTVFTDAMELHYIDMKAFARAVNETGSINVGDTKEIMFAKWLSIITQKEITDKSIIEDICKEEEAIRVAVSTLARQGEDKYVRQAYQRRQDEIYFYNKNMAERDEYKRQAEQERLRAEQERLRAEQERLRAEQEQSRAEIAENALEEKDALIAQLRARLGEK